jgi:hypothetical protein
MEPTTVLLFRVKGVCYRTELEAKTLAAGAGEWGTDETVTRVEALEWQGRLYTPSFDRIEAVSPEMTALYQRVGHAEFVRLRDQMRKS